MAQPDDRILELLRDEGPLKGWEIRHALDRAGVNMGYPERYLKQRYTVLLNSELIAEDKTGRYEVTDLGTAYLEGQLDAGTLDPEDEEESADTDSTEFIV